MRLKEPLCDKVLCLSCYQSQSDNQLQRWTQSAIDQLEFLLATASMDGVNVMSSIGLRIPVLNPRGCVHI